MTFTHEVRKPVVDDATLQDLVQQIRDLSYQLGAYEAVLMTVSTAPILGKPADRFELERLKRTAGAVLARFEREE